MYCLRATRRIAGCAPARRILTRFLSRCALRRTKMTPGARSNWRRKFRTIPCLLIWIILRSSRGCLMLLDAPDAPVLAFLKKYAGTAIADRMRNDYLLVLGARRAWRDFEAHYPQFALDDDPQVKCYALIPRAMRGEDIAQKAHALLRIAPKKYGEGCTDLVMTLAQQGQFAPEDVWPYLRFAYEMGEIAIGNRMAAALGAQQPDSEYLSLAASQPARLLERIQPDTHPSEAQLALLAVARLARTSPGEAAQAFSRIAPQLPPPLRAAGWGGIAWRAALEQMPDALGWYRLSKDAQLSNTALEWR